VAELAAWEGRIDEIEELMKPTMVGAHPPITNELEFEAFMNLIDTSLSSRGVPVPARQLEAIGEAAKLLKISLIGGPLSPGPPKVGEYRRANLSKRIRDWFRLRYGEKLKFDPSIGRTALLLRGDVWLLRIPRMFGNVDVVIDKDIEKTYPNVSGPAKPAQVTVNVLQLIEGFTPSIAKSLTEPELKSIHEAFAIAVVVFLLVDELKEIDPMMIAAKEDLQKAAEICVQGREVQGFSRWHSLQAVEKLLKISISTRGGTFAKNHQLKDQARAAQDLGGVAPDPKLLADVQCTADVRYEPSKTTIDDAVTAHNSAMAIARIVLADIKSAMSTKR
jgi:hypothetical protein